ncbi:ferrous iron transport protein B [Trichococcus patagoniensis]|uniref:Ferrous iron transport protein B n=1 Tax=Trichococcus patagoniensis TaxID=382641 RepID=A0A2T5IDV7_9LACT|nr:ferrous iron transport protein B [Trichococcus patagoniensis]PTQ82006.1 ferrous iron transport protein B [Trichococcus patagoniensis]
MGKTIALVGNPNSGKTTLFNHLTGSTQRVGNWPGVTVEQKAGTLLHDGETQVIDLPGIYSLSPYTIEEIVTRDYLTLDAPDLIINIVDASNLERNLYLTTQLMELDLPIVVVLNMMDIVEKRGDQLDVAGLSRAFGLPFVTISALKESGLEELFKAIAEPISVAEPITYSIVVESILDTIEEIIAPLVPKKLRCYYSIKLFERDGQTSGKLAIPEDGQTVMEGLLSRYEKELDDDSEAILINERYKFVTKITRQMLVKNSDKASFSVMIDHIVTNRWLGLPIFVLIMYAVYYFAITTVGTWGTDWVNDVLFGSIVPGAVQSFFDSIDIHPAVSSLVVDGAIGGVGAVLGFLPQMAALFLCLTLLEDSGYMARVAFVMDRVFRGFGLSGKSFIPLLIGSGCSVPGIQASRTIENLQDRRMTILTTSFIPCGAKLPVIALIANAIFGGASWVALSMYLLGISTVILSGVLLRKTAIFAGEASPFVMELPMYHWPQWKSIFRAVWARCLAFVKNAGTVIFLSSSFIWFLSSFNWQLRMTAESEQSILAKIGSAVAVFFAPLGFGSWQATVATIQGLIAKENVVGTFGVLMNTTGSEAEVAAAFSTLFNPVSAVSFLVFNMICMPCFAAVGAMRTEFGSAKWTLFGVLYQTTLAYVLAFIINQLGSVIVLGTPFGAGASIAAASTAILMFLVLRPAPKKASPMWGSLAKPMVK